MKIIIECKPYGNHYAVWQEGATAMHGPMMERRETEKRCFSKEEVLKAVAELLPNTTRAGRDNVEERRNN